MKRLNREARKQIVDREVSYLHDDWLACYGTWNRDTMLEELYKRLRHIRRQASRRRIMEREANPK